MALEQLLLRDNNIMAASPSSRPLKKCLWCGGQLKFWGVLKDSSLGIYPDQITYGLCGSCGSLGQFPPLSSWELGLAYSESYWVEGERDSPLKRLALRYQRKILSWDHGRFLRRALGPLKGKRLLEIGPGRGDFLSWAKGQGAEVMGWERAPQAVRLLQAQGLNAESVVLEDLSKWPASSKTWDVIVGFHVLEHLLDPTKVVAALIPRLSPHGLLVFQVPRLDSCQAILFGKRWFGLEVPRHVSIPTLKGLRRWVSQLGLSEKACKHFSLRDNSLIMMASVFRSLIPHRPDFGGFRLMGLLIGVWFLQPLAYLEALTGKGGTVMIALQPKN